jgi:hypothetical protein
VRLSGKATACRTLHDYKIYSSGDETNHQYGVGVIVNRRMAKYDKNFVTQSDRKVLIQLQSAPFKLNVMQVYDSTLDKAEEVEDFYEQVENIQKMIHKIDINKYMGNFNANVEAGRVNDTIKRWVLGERNEKGSRLIQFRDESDITVINTWFQLPKRGLYTWTSPQHDEKHVVRNQIDYMLINKRFRNSILNAKTYPGQT